MTLCHKNPKTHDQIEHQMVRYSVFLLRKERDYRYTPNTNVWYLLQCGLEAASQSPLRPAPCSLYNSSTWVANAV